jgi:hypothetical protein
VARRVGDVDGVVPLHAQLRGGGHAHPLQALCPACPGFAASHTATWRRAHSSQRRTRNGWALGRTNWAFGTYRAFGADRAFGTDRAFHWTYRAFDRTDRAFETFGSTRDRTGRVFDKAARAFYGTDRAHGRTYGAFEAFSRTETPFDRTFGGAFDRTDRTFEAFRRTNRTFGRTNTTLFTSTQALLQYPRTKEETQKGIQAATRCRYRGKPQPRHHSGKR